MAHEIRTREQALRAAQEAGDRSMHAGGRTAWSRRDMNVAAIEYDRIWPPEADAAASLAEFMAGEQDHADALARVSFARHRGAML